MSSPHREPLRCPNDGSRLVEMERADVLVDACPTCRGVWLDRGELDKILVKERQLMAGANADDDFYAEISGRPAAPSAPPRAPEPRRDERSQKKRRRRSLLEELLDFD
jgi:Zn-finger nucleic acid-binding protein